MEVHGLTHTHTHARTHTHTHTHTRARTLTVQKERIMLRQLSSPGASSDSQTVREVFSSESLDGCISLRWSVKCAGAATHVRYFNQATSNIALALIITQINMSCVLYLIFWVIQIPGPQRKYYNYPVTRNLPLLCPIKYICIHQWFICCHQMWENVKKKKIKIKSKPQRHWFFYQSNQKQVYYLGVMLCHYFIAVISHKKTKKASKGALKVQHVTISG